MPSREHNMREGQDAIDRARGGRRQPRAAREPGAGPTTGTTREADLGLQNSMEDDLLRLGLLDDPGAPAELPKGGIRPQRVRGRMRHRPRPTA